MTTKRQTTDLEVEVEVSAELQVAPEGDLLEERQAEVQIHDLKPGIEHRAQAAWLTPMHCSLPQQQLSNAPEVAWPAEVLSEAILP